MRATRLLFKGNAGNRGFAMGFVFVFVALLLIIAILVITGAFNATSSAQAVGAKYGVLNSAEAAANLALNRLAEDPTQPNGCVSGTLNGASNRSCIGYNNLNNPTFALATDYASGKLFYIPGHAAYIYGEAAMNNNRKVYVDAIAEPAPPLVLPGGVINAVSDVNDLTAQPINADPLYGSDADIHANRDINVMGAGSPVQGNTFAHGVDQLPGSGGVKNSGAATVKFPNTVQVQQAAQTALLLSKAGSQFTGGQISTGGTQTYSGNTYVNGDVNLTSGTVTFAAGSDVYINGNLCINGTASVINLDSVQGTFVVNGVVSSAGTGGYQVSNPDNNTLMLVLGNDVTSGNPCGNGATDAVFLAPFGIEPVGTIYAANGSVRITSTGSVIGALDAGVNVNVSGNSGSSMRYDHNQTKTTLPTGTMSYTAYNQY